MFGSWHGCVPVRSKEAWGLAAVVRRRDGPCFPFAIGSPSPPPVVEASHRSPTGCHCVCQMDQHSDHRAPWGKETATEHPPVHGVVACPAALMPWTCLCTTASRSQTRAGLEPHSREPEASPMHKDLNVLGNDMAKPVVPVVGRDTTGAWCAHGQWRDTSCRHFS